MVLIAVPHTGNVRVDLVTSLIDLNERDDVELYFNYEKPVEANRCMIANYFMDETDHEYLLMVDSDILIPDNILDLIDYEKKIISPLVLSNQDGVPFPVAAQKDEEGRLSLWCGEKEELVEVDAIGTACMFIHRDVFEDLEHPYFEFEQNKKDGSIYVSEDFGFCLKALEKGYQPYLASDYVTGHIAEVNLERYLQTLKLALESDPSQMFAFDVGGSNKTN